MHDRHKQYNELQETKKRMSDKMQTASLFDDPQLAAPVNTAEYWWTSDLNNIISVDIFNPMLDNTFSKLHDAMIDINTPTNMIYSHIGPDVLRDYLLYPHRNSFTYRPVHKRRARDTKISRYAVWAAIRNKPEHAFAAAFMSMPGATFQQISDWSDVLFRVYARFQMKLAYKKLCGLLHSQYQNKISLPIFNNALHNSFYANMRPIDIKALFAIPVNEIPIFDYMGARSMVIRTSALDKIYGHANECNPSAPQLEFIAAGIMLNARKEMINTYKTTPEMDISQRNVKELRTQVERQSREFAAEYINCTIR